MSDDAPETPVDNSATLCTSLVVMTTVMLIGACFVVLSILATQYQRGMLA